VDRIAVREQVADDRVTHLVVGRDLAFLLRKDPGLLLGTGDDPHDPLFELVLGDLLLARAGTQQGGLVDEVREVCSGEARRLTGQGIEVDVPCERLAAGVDLENLLAALAIGAIHRHLTVETARPEQSRIEDVGAVGGGDQDDVVLDLEAVHLDQ
jgi:hypothetical protein